MLAAAGSRAACEERGEWGGSSPAEGSDKINNILGPQHQCNVEIVRNNKTRTCGSYFILLDIFFSEICALHCFETHW